MPTGHLCVLLEVKGRRRPGPVSLPHTDSLSYPISFCLSVFFQILFVIVTLISSQAVIVDPRTARHPAWRNCCALIPLLRLASWHIQTTASMTFNNNIIILIVVIWGNVIKTYELCASPLEFAALRSLYMIAAYCCFQNDLKLISMSHLALN